MFRIHLANFLRVPSEIPPKSRWFYSAAISAAPLAVFVHSGFVLIFAYWQVDELAIYNVGAVAMYMAMVYALRQRHLYLTAVMAWTEVITHAILCVYFVGWEAGVQYYLFILLIGGVMVTEQPWLNFVINLTVVTIFLILYAISLTAEPIYTIKPSELHLFFAYNLANTFNTVTVISLYFRWVILQAENAVEREHQRSEDLLHNVLPTPIAERLKLAQGIIADKFEAASILFADIVGFTVYSQQVTPEELVTQLNGVFSGFDELVARYDLEKIKTIGDAYMVAAGVPIPRPDHAEVLARFALEMREVLQRYNQASGIAFQIRIGIHSGEVVAGVIGKHRFLYDLWGDSVNTASRMESHGHPGEIQVSEAVYNLISSHFTLEERGMVEVKGKGLMRTFWLRGAKPAS